MHSFPVMPARRRAGPTLAEIAIIAIVASVVTGLLLPLLSIHEPPPQPSMPMTHEEDPMPTALEETPMSQPMEVEKQDWSGLLSAYSAPRAYDEIGQGEGVPPELCPEALKTINAAIRRRPRSSNALCKRAWLCITMGHHRQAIKDAMRALRLNRRNFRATEALRTASSSLGI